MNLSNSVFAILLLVIGIGIGSSFTNKNEKQVSVAGYTIDLPEEISQSTGNDLVAIKDGNTIKVQFANQPDYDILRTDAEIALYERYRDQILSSDYQLELFPDYIRVMDKGREIGRLSYKTSLGRIVERDNW